MKKLNDQLDLSRTHSTKESLDIDIKLGSEFEKDHTANHKIYRNFLVEPQDLPKLHGIATCSTENFLAEPHVLPKRPGRTISSTETLWQNHKFYPFPP